MKKKVLGNLIVKFMIIPVCLFVLAGCAILPTGKGDTGRNAGISNPSGDSDKLSGNQEKSFIPVPNMYKFGFPYITGRLTDDQMMAEYQEWKSHYLNNYAPPFDGYTSCIMRDAGSAYDTVSEGIGYGMLLAVYFNDPDVFFRLYHYTVMHTNNGGLMHWRVRSDGTNIDEVGYPVPHQNLFTNGSGTTNNYSGTTPPPSWGSGWGLLLGSRNLTSATDADEDIAMALAIAGKIWGGNGWDYRVEALKWISNIMKYDLHPGWGNPQTSAYSPFLGAGYYTGGTWGGNNPSDKPGWSPCYYTPAWYPVFKQLSGDPQWDTFTNNMWNNFAKIDTANGGTGLYPDWCNTSGASCVQTTTCSDRGKQSYNCYYDAIRVPWRMAMAASWYNDSKALVIAKKNAANFKTAFYAGSIVDGYTITGGTWDPNLRDPGATTNGGKYPNSVVFYSMIGSSTMVNDDMTYGNDFYSWIASHKVPYSDDFHYYGNTLRLLTLLYMNGEMINPFDTNNYQSITVNQIPGLVNAEDYIATNGINYLTNTFYSQSVGTICGAVVGYYPRPSIYYAVSNSLTSPAYGIYSITYRVNAYSPNHSSLTYVGGNLCTKVDNAEHGIANINAVNQTSWKNVSHNIVLTPGNHIISVYATSEGYQVGSFKIAYLGNAPVNAIPGTINLNWEANFNGCSIGAASASGLWTKLNSLGVTASATVLTLDYYNAQGNWADYVVNVPGTPGGPAAAYTYNINVVAISNSSKTTVNTIIKLGGTNILANVTSPISGINTLTGTIMLSPGLQMLRFIGDREAILSISIN